MAYGITDKKVPRSDLCDTHPVTHATTGLNMWRYYYEFRTLWINAGYKRIWGAHAPLNLRRQSGWLHIILHHSTTAAMILRTTISKLHVFAKQTILLNFGGWLVVRNIR